MITTKNGKGTEITELPLDYRIVPTNGSEY